MAKLINGNGNKAIWAAQDADMIASICGNITSIAAVGSQFSYTQEDANTIGVADGVIITKEGRRIQLDTGSVDLFTIPTGVLGETSYYIIGYHLIQNLDTTQVCETFVQKMDNATDVIVENTFKGGATEVYVSLYRVTQNGMNIDTVDLLLPELSNVAGLISDLSGFSFRNNSGTAQYSMDNGETWENFSSGAVLIGTYSANATINVSAYGATSASQFLIVPNSLTGSPSYYRFTGATQDTIDFSCSFSPGSKTLSNNILNVIAPTVSFSGTKKEGSANPFNISGSAKCPYRVYFIGN